MCQAHHGRSSDLGPLCLYPCNCYLTLAASPAGFATLIPQVTGQGTLISKERGLWPLLPSSCRLSSLTPQHSRTEGTTRQWHSRDGGRWHHIRKKEGKAETAPSGFPLLNNCFVVKTIIHSSTARPNDHITSVISRELVCQRVSTSCPQALVYPNRLLLYITWRSMILQYNKTCWCFYACPHSYRGNTFSQFRLCRVVIRHWFVKA